MRYLEIVTFVFLINISINIIMMLNLSPIQIQSDYSDWNSTIISTIKSNYSATTVTPGIIESVLQVTGDFLSGVSMFISLLAHSTIFVNGMWSNLMMCGTNTSCNNLATLLAVPMWLIYGIAIIQIILGRSFKGDT